jgi:hypothetical protein
LQHVAEGLQGAVAGAGDGAAMAAVVEQGVHRFLQHALFVADDDIGRLQLQQVAQTVVAVDDATVEVVQVGGGEAAAFERHERTQVGRNDRQDFEDHPLGTGVGAQERLQHLDALGQLLAVCLLRVVSISWSSSVDGLPPSRCASSGRARPRRPSWPRRPSPYLSWASRNSSLAEELLLLQRGVAGIDDDVVLVIEDALEERAVMSSTRPMRLGVHLKNQMCETGTASSMWPMRSRRTRASVTSTPQRSQITPLCLMRLYFPQAHSQSLVGPKMRSQNRPPFSGLNVR